MQSSYTVTSTSPKTSPFVSSSSNIRPRPILHTLKYVITHQGTAALYKGLVPASLGSILSWACYFHIVQRARKLISPYVSHTTSVHLISSSLAGVITSITTNPIWVVKVRLQLQQQQHSTANIAKHMSKNFGKPYNGFFDGLITIAREEGVTGLYKGISPSLWLVSHGALQYTLYETIKSYLRHENHNSNNNSNNNNNHHHHHTNSNIQNTTKHALIASTASKLIASISTYPLQVVRTRMQERKADRKRYGSFYRALMHITETEGISGLYRGLSANIARVTPQAAVTFITYEHILRLCASTTDR